MKIIIILSSVFFLFGCIQNAQAQQEIKKGVKFGIEFTDYVSTKAGGFSKEPGISFGYFTGINLYTNSPSAILLGLEFNFTRVIRYRANYELIYPFEYRLNRYVFDQKFKYSFVEFGLLPKYQYSLNENIAVEFFIGPSGGIGTQYLQNNRINRTTIDTLGNSGEMYGPYGEYNMDRYKSFVCFNLGTKGYYNIFVIDLRYRYTYVGNLNEINNFKNVYVQIGLTF